MLVLGVLLFLVVGVVFFQRIETGLIVLLVVRASTDISLSYLRGALGSQPGEIDRLLSPNVALILVLILAGGFYILRNNVPVLGLPGGKVFVLWLLVGLIGSLRSNAVSVSFSEWLPVVSSLVVFALVAHLLRDTERIQRIINALAVSFILPAVFGLRQLVMGEGNTIAIGVTRIHGTFTHPNPYGLYLVVILSVFLSQVLHQSGRRKWLSLAIVVAGAVLLVGTFARFAWVGAAVVILTMGLLRRRILLFIVPLLVAVALVTSPGIRARLEDPLGTQGSGSSLGSRLVLWETILRGWLATTSMNQGALAVALDRFAGLGPGAFGPILVEASHRVTPPHNDYVRMVVEYGVFGSLLYVILFLLLIRLAYRTWLRADGMLKGFALSFLALTLAYPVMSLTANVFTQTVNQVYFWSLAGIVVAISNMSAAQKSDSTRSKGRPSEMEF